MATTPPAPSPAPKAKRYRALTPIDFNNKRYEIGKTLPADLSAEQAAELLAVQAIELAGKVAEEGEAE